jgi:hypothetical protein
VTNYYVYYRVDPARLADVRASIEQLFSRIERETGVKGRWMHRRDDPATYMEVYESVRDSAAFDALLEHAASGLGLERKVERFVCA